MTLRRNRQHGTTAVEFAFVSPLLFLFVFGLFEFGRAMMLQQALTNAAREGSRLSSLASTVNAQDVEDRVRDHLEGAIAGLSDPNKVRVDIAPNTSLATMPSETVITVEVDVDYADVSLFAPWFLGQAEIHGEAQMKRE